MRIYVNATAVRSGDGSKERPFKKIGDAAKIAVAGDEVLVAPGVYREYVDPVNAGEEHARISYRSEIPLGAKITGAEEVKDWKHYQDNVWVTEIDNSIFGSYNPYTTFVEGDWYFYPSIRHTGAVYLNDRQLYETETLEECLKGEIYIASWEPENSIFKWYTEQADNKTVIYANFQGADPRKEHVEINVRRNCFFPSKTGVNYITLSGFEVSKAATTWAPPASFQDGMVGPHWSKGWIIEDCEISHSKCVGISLGKYCDPENDQYFTHRHVKSPTQMERDAVCRGQYHGWTKEAIGSHIVRRCNIHHCEQAGIAGRMGAVFSVIEDNHVHHINNMMQLIGPETAAIKIHAAIDVIFRRNHIDHSIMGIWCDWQAQGTRITQNLFHDNQPPKGVTVLPGTQPSQDVFIEVGHGPTLIDNNVMLSRISVRIASQGVACVNNLMLGPCTCIGGGSDYMIDDRLQVRYTPYHFHHRTEVSGFMSILHGDNRFYNNIFVQHWPVEHEESVMEPGFDVYLNERVGTEIFDDYMTYEEWISQFDFTKRPDMLALMNIHYRRLPVWIEGNAYFSGARAFKKEKHNLVCDDEDVYVRVKEADGTFVLETNLYEKLGKFKDGIICTETLGKAFEPEEAFENPDGTPIQFDTDYFGNHRGISAVPGPFAEGKSVYAL